MTPERVRQAIAVHPSVRGVTLSGSRARGDATSLSDWDFEVETEDFASLKDALPSLIAPIEPLVTLWDPLADHATFMLILSGPTKVDLIFEEPVAPLPPYDVRADNLQAIDAHFWDWCLWLTSKRASGKTDLLAEELTKMTNYILEPMGVRTSPSDLGAAVDLYLAARDEQETRTGVRVSRELGSQVARVVRGHAEVS